MSTTKILNRFFFTLAPSGGVVAESSATDERHSGGHHRHELHIGIQRQVGHVEHSLSHVPHIHARLHHHSAVGLRHPLLHTLGHFGGGVANVDLAARDIEVSPI